MALSQQGFAERDIAEELGVSRTTVYNDLQKQRKSYAAPGRHPKHYEVVAHCDAAIQSGKTPSYQEVAAAVGIGGADPARGARQVRHIWDRERIEREAREDERIHPPMDWETIPGSQRQKLERATETIRKKMEKEFRTRLLAELDQYRAKLDSDFAAHKAAYDAQNTAINEMRNEERQRYKLGIEVARAKGLITPDEYTVIRSCLHPDSRVAVSDEKLAAAFRLFNDPRIKALLVKEK